MDTDFGNLDWQQEYRRSRRIIKAGIPDRYIGKTLEDWRQDSKEAQSLYRRAMKFIDRFPMPDPFKGPSGFLIWGNPGTGKSLMHSIIMQEILNRGHEGRFLRLTQYFGLVKETYQDGSEQTEKQVIEELIFTPVLGIDDMGVTGEVSGWAHEKIYDLINGRYEKGVPTFVTTNLAYPDELKLSVGDRVVSRLAEMCEIWGSGAVDQRMKGISGARTTNAA